MQYLLDGNLTTRIIVHDGSDNGVNGGASIPTPHKVEARFPDVSLVLTWRDWERGHHLWVSDFAIAQFVAFLNAKQEEHEYEGRKELDQRRPFVSLCKDNVFP